MSAETEAKLEPNHRTTADLVIEVISPGSAIYDRNTKADTYAALEVKELWLVDEVAKAVEIRKLSEGRFPPAHSLEQGEQVRSQVLPAIVFDVHDVFS